MKNYPGIKKIFPYLKKHKFSIIVFFMISIILGFISTLPVLFLGNTIDMIVNPNSTKGFLSEIMAEINNVYLLFIIIGVLLIISELSNSLFGYFVSNFGIKIKSEIKKDILKNIIRNYNPVYSELKEGDILTRISKDIDAVNQVIVAPINGLVRDFINLFWVVCVFMIWNWEIALVSMMLMLPVYFVSKRIGKSTKEFSGRINKIEDDVNNYSLSIVKNLKLVHLLRTHDYEIQKSATFINKTEKQTKKLNKILSFLFPLVGIIKVIGIISVLCLTYYFIFRGKLTIGAITIAYIYVRKLYSPLVGFSRYSRTFAAADKSLSRVFELKELQSFQYSEDGTKIKRPPEIVISDVDFEYENKKIYELFNTIIKANEITVLKSKSGKGKTTLLNLLIGLVDPSSGKIKINGLDNKQIDFSSASILFQEALLFNRTLKENIIYGNDNYSQDKFEVLLDKLSLREFYIKNGPDYVIDSNNQNISGGERRRICLFRALLKDSFLYILDEPTSELDKEISEKIIGYINSLKGKATFVISTHDDVFTPIADSIIDI